MNIKAKDYSHRILIVDDNPSIHEDFRKVFTPHPSELPEIDDFDSSTLQCSDRFDGLRFESAHQGMEAIERVRSALEEELPFALAFVDMRMPPGIDGLQTIRELWKIDPELQVVICTAYSDHSWEDAVSMLGRTHNLLVLKKPFDDVEVLQMAIALTSKWEASRAAGIKRSELEELVRARTEELERAALHDGLTGLANRLKFHDRLAKVLKRSDLTGPAVVFLIDLDQFKYINDTLGHPAGDELIRVIAQRLSATVGTSGLVARFGGDEFAVVLDQCVNERSVESLALAIQAAIAFPILLEGYTLTVTSSLGISMAFDDQRKSDELIRNADIALYRAKADGRNCVRFFEAGMDEELCQRRLWESRLRTAVENEEFVLFYQPLLSADSKKIHSFEALLRWNHPELGLIPPDRFIPLAEETGLIKPIGDWVLMEACSEAKNWPDDIGIAVNVSVVQFRQGLLPESVGRALAATGIDAKRLEIEITESVLMNESNCVLDQLHALKELGVRIALDDFGTGYSSLSYLRKFPFDKLKMDKSFVQNLEQADALAIISTIANLGKCLGMITTAEGIETEHQLRCVLDEGFTQVQGYLYGRPMPGNELQTMHFPVCRDGVRLGDAPFQVNA